MSVETTRNGTPRATTVNLSTLLALLGMFASAAIAWGDLQSRLTSMSARVDVLDTSTSARVELLDVGGTARLSKHEDRAVLIHKGAVNEARSARGSLETRIDTLEACVRRPKRCNL